MNTEDPWIQPSKLAPLRGDEPLGSKTVLDFWRWALGDLRMNNIRGHLVEYLVGQALGDSSPVRVEWGPYDVEAPDGTLVEIKTSGRLQSWATRTPSSPKWSFKSVRAMTVWSHDLGDYVAVDPATRVHVWVFALHTVTVPEDYDPLDTRQWEFRVIAHRQLLASGQTSASLSTFERFGVTPVPYEGLRRAVADARRRNDAWA